MTAEKRQCVHLVFGQCHSCLHTHTYDKEEVFIPIWAVLNTVRHVDRHVHAHTQQKNVWATCNAGRPNYYQLLCINKSSDESATPNTLETLPRPAHCRRTGQIGRRGRWEGRARERRTRGGDRKANDKRKRWIRREGGLRGRENKSFIAEMQQHLLLEGLRWSFTA